MKNRKIKKSAELTVLLGVVVFVAVSLMLADLAKAMTGALICEKEEHVHTSECYALLEGEWHCPAEDLPHEHDDSCYESQMVLMCQEDHEHVDECYGVEKVLTCHREECVVAHTHDDHCYKGGEPVCGLREVELHQHDESCYASEIVLACEEDHAHTEECYRETQVLICEREEIAAHAHDESCYEDGVLACGKKAVVVHSHDENCCGEDAMVLSCGKEAHVHTDSCYKESQEELIKANASVDEESYGVYVNYESRRDARALTGISVEEITPGNAQYASLMEQTAYLLDKDNTYVRFFDITPLDKNEKETEPNGNADVTVDLKTLMEEDEHLVANMSDVQVLHFTEEEVKTLDATNEDTTVTFTTNGFSVFAVVYTVDFHYGGYTQTMRGESCILLSQLLKRMEIDLDVHSVDAITFSNPNLLRISRVSGMIQIDEETAVDAGDQDWLLESLSAFDTNEELTIVTDGGVCYVIDVTDAVEVNYYDNLDGFVRDAYILVGGKEIHFGETAFVRPDTSYTLAIKFKEEEGHQFHEEGPLYYDLPDGIILPDGFRTIMEISLGRKGRLYNPVTYDKANNRLVIEYEDNPIMLQYFNDAATASMLLSFTANLDLTKNQIIFAQDKVLGLEKEDLHNAKVVKVGDFDSTLGVVHYKVYVESDGTTSQLVLTDEPGQALVYLPDTFRFNDTGNADDVRFDPYDDLSWSKQETPYTKEDLGNSFQVTIPSMCNGERIVFSYDCYIDVNNIAVSGQAEFAETGNTVTIAGDDIPEDNVSTHWEDKVSYSDLEKDVTNVSASYYDEDGVKYKNLHWRIETNQKPQLSFANTTVTDNIGASVHDKCNYTGEGIVVYVYTADDTLVDTRNVSWLELGVDVNTDYTWTYAIPAEDRLPYRYVFEYDTRINMDLVNSGGKDVYVDNYAYGKGGRDSAIEIIHPEGTGLGVAKRAISYTVGDTDTDPVTMGTVHWAMTIHLTEDMAARNCQLFTELYTSEFDYATGMPILIKANGDPTVKYGFPSRWVGPEFYKEYIENIERDVAVTGLLENETYLAVVNDGKPYDPSKNVVCKFEIQFFHDITKEELLALTQGLAVDQWPAGQLDPYRGLSGLGGLEERNVMVDIHTLYHPNWILKARDAHSYGGVYNHLNVVDVGRYYSSSDNTKKRSAETEAGARAVDKIAPRGTHTSKRVLRNYESISTANNTSMYMELRDDGYTYPLIMFQIAVTGVETNEPLIITDKFDTSIWKLWTQDVGNYNYVDRSNGQVKTYWAHNIIPRFGAYDQGDWISSAYPTKDDPNPANPPTWYWQAHNCYARDKETYLRREGTIVETTDDGARFIINDVPTKPNGKFWNTYLVEYYLTPKDDEALRKIAEMALANGGQKNGLVTFENVATSRGESDTAQFDLPVPVDFKPVNKSMVEKSKYNDVGELMSKVMECSLTLNPGRLTLNDGQPMYMTDTYSETLAIEFDTIQIETYPEGRENEVSYDFTKNTGTFLVPDQTRVKITYDAKVALDEKYAVEKNGNKVIPVSNSATLMKYDENVDKDVIFESTSSGETEIPVITLYKFAAGHMEIGLPGAQFQIFTAVPVRDPSTNAIIYEDNGHPQFTYTPLTTLNGEEIIFTTDQEGKITLSLTSVVHGKNFKYSSDFATKTVMVDGSPQVRVDWDNSTISEDDSGPGIHVYAAKEINPPDGYIQDDVYYRFAILRENEASIFGDFFYSEYSMMTVRNYKETVELELTKEFTGNGADDLSDEEKGAITFSIVHENGDPIMEEDDPAKVDETFQNIPYSVFVNGRFKFTRLGIGRYRIVENNADVSERHPGLNFLRTFLWDGIEGTDTFQVTEKNIQNNDTLVVTMVNDYSKSVVDLQVQKKWQNTFGQAILWPGATEVTMDLYIKDGDDVYPAVKDGSPISVTLDGIKDGNGEEKAGTAFFNGLPELANGEEYVAKERTNDAIAAGFDTIYSTNEGYSTFAKSANNMVATVVNKQKATSIAVNKFWKQTNTDMENNPPLDATATFRLFSYVEGADPATAKRVSVLNDITVTGEPWRVEFANLPLVNSNGQKLVYIVKELSTLSDYSPDYLEGKGYAADGETIVNHPGTTDFTFKKEWRNTMSNQWPDNIGVIVDITRRLGYRVGEDTYYKTDAEFKASYLLTKDSCTLMEGSSVPQSWDGIAITPGYSSVNNTYVFKLEGLGKVGVLDDVHGTWEYMVGERETINTNDNTTNTDFNVIYYQNGQALPSGTTQIANGGVIRNSGKMLTKTFAKTWKDDAGNLIAWPENHVISMKLNRQFKYQENGKEYIVADSSNWASIALQANENGIVEGSVSTHDGIEVSYGEGVYTISNLPYYGVGRGGGISRYGEYVYAFEETSVLNGSQATEYLPVYTITGHHTDIANRVVPKIDIPVQKTWLAGNGSPVDNTKILPVELTLYRLAEGYEPSEGDGHIIVDEATYIPVTVDREMRPINPSIRMDGSESWTHTFTDLPVYTDDTRTEEVVYLVRETMAKVDPMATGNLEWVDDVDTYYSVSYSGNAENGFVVNNSPESVKTEVVVNKSWQENMFASAEDGAVQVSFDVYRTTQPLVDDDLTEINIVRRDNASERSNLMTQTLLAKEGDIIAMRLRSNELASWKEKDANNVSREFYRFNCRAMKNNKNISLTILSIIDEDGVDLSYRLFTNNTEFTKYNANNNGSSGPPLDPSQYSFARNVYATMQIPANTTTLTVNNAYPVDVWFANESEYQRERERAAALIASGDAIKVGSGTVNAADGWSTKVEDLDLTDEDGNKYNYFVVETSTIPGFEPWYSFDNDSINIINMRTDEPLPATRTVTAYKQWQNLDETNVSPAGATVEFSLYADGVKLEGSEISLDGVVDDSPASANYEASPWVASWTNVPQFQEDGVTPIAYAVKETSGFDGYAANTEFVEHEGTIVNIQDEPNTVTMTAHKAWRNRDNSTVAPVGASVVFSLFADNAKVEGKDVVLNGSITTESDHYESSPWTAAWTDLPAENNNVPINYSVRETTGYPGYAADKTSVADNGTIVNVQNPVAKIDVTAAKAWSNLDHTANAPEGASVVFSLFADGEKVEGKDVTLDGTVDPASDHYESSAWMATWTDLNKYKNDDVTEIVYTIKETLGYTGYEADLASVHHGHTITNHQSKPAPTTVIAHKAWLDDAGNATAPSGANVVFALFADDVEVTDSRITLDGIVDEKETAAWTAAWVDVPSCKEDNVTPIAYTVKEVVGYSGYLANVDSVSNGGTIVNVKSVAVRVAKKWQNADGGTTVPEGAVVTFALYADGILSSYSSITLDGVEDEYEPVAWTAEWADLPRYHDDLSSEIVYQAHESHGYINYVPDREFASNGETIVNIQPVTIVAKKAWRNADGSTIAPEGATVTFGLYADGVAVAGKKITMNGLADVETSPVEGEETMPAGNGLDHREPMAWHAVWENLPYYVENSTDVITYTIKEETDYEGYVRDKSVTTNNGTITNIQTLSVEVDKAWVNVDGDAFMPENTVATLSIFANGNRMTGKDITLDGVVDEAEPSPWHAVWTGLPAFDQSGSRVSYQASETGVPDGYAVDAAYASNGGTIVNHQLTSVTARKAWKNADGTATPPTDATAVLQLYADGVAMEGKSVTLDGAVDSASDCYESSAWVATWKNLPALTAGGEKIVYTIKETSHYASHRADKEFVSSGETITNIEIIDITVNKAWRNQYDTDPPEGATVSFQLYANGVAVNDALIVLDGKTDTEHGDYYESAPWTATWRNLHTCALDDTEIIYTVSETASYLNYQADVAHVRNNATITNYEPIVVTGQKAWKNIDGSSEAPSGATAVFELYADDVAVAGKRITLDGVEDEESDCYESAPWQATFRNLPALSDSGLISYTMKEVSHYSDYKADKEHIANNEILTNIELTDVSVAKAWMNADGSGEAPSGVSVTFQLYANDEYQAGKDIVLDGIPDETGEAIPWVATWQDLHVYIDDTEMIYTVKESSVTAGYQADKAVVENGGVITNKALRTVSVDKAWKNADGSEVAPNGASVTFQLYANDEYQAGKDIVLDGSVGWTAAWHDLPVFDETDRAITYTVKEASDYSGYRKDKEYAFDKETIVNCQVKDVTAHKAWWNMGNTAVAPSGATATFQLYADGVHLAGKDIVLDGSVDDNEPEPWMACWKDMDTYAGGNKIVYTIHESDGVAHYRADKAFVGDGETITNRQLASVTVHKAWLGPEGTTSPEHATVVLELYADGVATGKTVTLNGIKDVAPEAIPTAGEEIRPSSNKADCYEVQDWVATWLDLDAMNGDTPIVYTVLEAQGMAGYAANTDNVGDGGTITNCSLMDYAVDKAWLRANGTQDAPEGVSVVFKLYANGIYQEGKDIVLDGTMDEMGEDEAWKAVWKNLPAYDGLLNPIVYHVEEEALEGYHSIAGQGTIVNSELTSVKVYKKWQNAEGDEAPASAEATFKLYANGAYVEGKDIVLDGVQDEAGEREAWVAVWDDLESHTPAGAMIHYSVEEDVGTLGYRPDSLSVTDGQTLTNRELTTFSAHKQWLNVDKSNTAPDGATVTFQLCADGEPLLGKTLVLDGVVNDDGDGYERQPWEAYWKNLDQFNEAGEKIQYTVTESVGFEGYRANKEFVNNGEAIVNMELTSVLVEKNWLSLDDSTAWPQGAEVSLQLCVGDEPIENAVVVLDGVADENPTSDFYEIEAGKAYWGNLDMFNEVGTKYVYRVKEVMTFRNYEPMENIVDAGSAMMNRELTSLTVRKAWLNHDKTTNAPEHAAVTFQLYSGENPVAGKAVRLDGVADPDPHGDHYESDAWTATFDSLPRFDMDGFEITYSVKESHTYPSYKPDKMLAGAGDTITNKELTTVTVHKRWQNVDGTTSAPENAKVTLALYRDGILIPGSEVELDGMADTHSSDQLEIEPWVAAWHDLDVFSENNEDKYSYSVSEITGQSGYVASGESVEPGGTIVNVEQKDFTFYKAWVSGGQNISSIAMEDLLEWPDEMPITVTVRRRDEHSSLDNKFLLKYVIRKGDAVVEPDDDKMTDEDKQKYALSVSEADGLYMFRMAKELDPAYVYQVSEEIVSKDYMDPLYGVIDDGSILYAADHVNGAGDDDVIINQENTGYAMPESGGPGTGWLMAAGAMICLGTLAFVLKKKIA